MEKFSLTIDDKKVKAREGQTILEVALENGIEIPNLCHDPRLTPVGACRLCIVEVEGDRGLQTSCTRAAAPDMVVRTNTERIREIRKMILELLLSEHRISCTTCDRDGDCLLQKYAYEYQADEYAFGMVEARPEEENYTTGNRNIGYDPRKCILCQRCVRICEERQVNMTLTLRGRAASVQVSTAFDAPLDETACQFCGACIATCPTGALYERSAKGLGRSTDLDRVRTTCPYCGVGCRLDLHVNRKLNKIVRVTSEPGCIPNDGLLCVKGKFGFGFVEHPDRLKTPLIKRNGKFEPASWDEALDLVAARLREVKEKFGPDAIGVLSSAKCTNEENYLLQKFARAVIGTNNVDHCARLCHASTVAGLVRCFGSGAMTNSIEEIEHADAVFVIGSNTTETHPVIGKLVKRAVVYGDMKLIVADPRSIELSKVADVHIKQRSGTDVALLNGMMHVIIEEGMHDEEFIKERTENFDALAETVKKYTPEVASEITGVPAEDIVKAARIYGGAEKASILYAMGITQHTTGTDNVLSIANLAMLTGNVGRYATGVNPLRGQNNVQGACDLGALPNVYPGYQKVDDPEVRQKFQAAWKAGLSPDPGLTVVEMMHAAADGKIKAMYFMGENPMLSDPNVTHVREALENLDFLVVQDIFLSETAELADVVLPTACFAEKDGTFTNTERRIQVVKKALDPPGEARLDWRIICDLSARLGYPMDYESPGQIIDEIASVTPIYGGITSRRLGDVGLQWPCPDEDHPGTKFLHEGSFKRGLGKFHAIDFIEAKEPPDKEYPFLLTTGRRLEHFHTGTMTRRCEPLESLRPKPQVEINSEDAAELQVSTGDRVAVESRRGRIELDALVTDDIKKGTVFIAFHFREAAANVLTIDALDPVAKIPEYKVCGVRVEKLSGN